MDFDSLASFSVGFYGSRRGQSLCETAYLHPLWSLRGHTRPAGREKGETSPQQATTGTQPQRSNFEVIKVRLPNTIEDIRILFSLFSDWFRDTDNKNNNNK